MTLGDLLARIRNATGDFRPANWNDRAHRPAAQRRPGGALAAPGLPAAVHLRSRRWRNQRRVPAAGAGQAVVRHIVESPDGFDARGLRHRHRHAAGRHSPRLRQHDRGTQMGAPIQSPQWLTGQPVPYPYQAASSGRPGADQAAVAEHRRRSATRSTCAAASSGFCRCRPPSTSTILIDRGAGAALMGWSRRSTSRFCPLELRQRASSGGRSPICATPTRRDRSRSAWRWSATRPELAQNVSTVERLQATNPKIWVPLTVRGLHRFNQIGWGGQGQAAAG